MKNFYDIRFFNKDINYIMQLLEQRKDIYADIILRNMKSQTRGS